MLNVITLMQTNKIELITVILMIRAKIANLRFFFKKLNELAMKISKQFFEEKNGVFAESNISRKKKHIQKNFPSSKN